MLRSLFFLIFVPSLLLSCSPDRPVPVAPAGKIASLASAPVEPTNLRCEVLSDTSVKVLWDAVDGATDYDINYKKIPGGKWTNEPHKGAARRYNTLYRLEAETEYRWAVRAENADGPSDWVFGENFTTLDEQEDVLEEEVILGESTLEPTPSVEVPMPEDLEPFNIELKFLQGFYDRGYTQEDEERVRYAASRWEEVLSDIPDWQLSPGWHAGRSYCGTQFIYQPSSVDDIKIFIGGLTGWGSTKGIAMGGFTRGNSDQGPGFPTYGCVSLAEGIEKENLAMIVAHEIGHVFGFGSQFVVPPPHGWLDVLVTDEWGDNPVFFGPQASSVYALAGGQGHPPLASYTDKQTGNGGHWRSPILDGTLMSSQGNKANPFEISSLDLAAMKDMGYPVRMDQATPLQLNLGSGKPGVVEHPDWCGVGQAVP